MGLSDASIKRVISSSWLVPETLRCFFASSRLTASPLGLDVLVSVQFGFIVFYLYAGTKRNQSVGNTDPVGMPNGPSSKSCLGPEKFDSNQDYAKVNLLMTSGFTLAMSIRCVQMMPT